MGVYRQILEEPAVKNLIKEAHTSADLETVFKSKINSDSILAGDNYKTILVQFITNNLEKNWNPQHKEEENDLIKALQQILKIKDIKKTFTINA